MKTPWRILVALMVAAGLVALTWRFSRSRWDTDPTAQGPPTSAGKEEALLSFPSRVVPAEGEPPLLGAVRQPGWCDFWFWNPQDHAVTVWLAHKTCQCSGASLFLVPPTRPVEYILAQVGTGGTTPAASGLASGLTTLALAASKELWAADQLQRLGEGIALTTEDRAVVPPHAVGAVRLSWNADIVERRRLAVDLGLEAAGKSSQLHFEALVVLVSAVEAEAEIAAGVVREQQLPQVIPVYCYSRIYSSLRVRAEVVHDGRPAEADTVEVGEAVPASQPERKALQARLGVSTLRCAYRVPVTLRAAARDGTPCELGVFRRRIELHCEEDPIRVQPVEVSGEVPGPLRVGTPADRGQVALGPFVAEQGKEVRVRLQGESAGLQLEVDRGRIPKFLGEPKLQGPEAGPLGQPTWWLVLRVPPGPALGRFPDPENPLTRDSAVYLKTKDRPPRTIRIPVSGRANPN
jgi:hypothetical protein